jgi:hypothetical protein
MVGLATVSGAVLAPSISAEAADVVYGPRVTAYIVPKPTVYSANRPMFGGNVVRPIYIGGYAGNIYEPRRAPGYAPTGYGVRAGHPWHPR